MLPSRLVFYSSLILLLATAAHAQLPVTTVTHPMPAVTLTQQDRFDPPLRLHWVQVDLTNPAVHIRVCPGGIAPAAPWQTTLLQVSKIAARERLDVAVNGSLFSPKDIKSFFGIKDQYFQGNPAMAIGWTVCDRLLLSPDPRAIAFSTLLVAGNGQVSIRQLSAPPFGARQAVSGVTLLDARHILVPDNEPAPRTAAGLDAAAHTLTLFVVDGHRSFSEGLSLRNIALEMLKLGCTDAISLDGGGSSTLVVRNNGKWPVINTPSDGHTLPIPLSLERPVADALGIVVDAPAK